MNQLLLPKFGNKVIKKNVILKAEAELQGLVYINGTTNCIMKIFEDKKTRMRNILFYFLFIYLLTHVI